MSQKWYKKASVQSALINAIPNLVIAGIAIASLIITFFIYKKQASQNQGNFEIQMERDSLLNDRQDSVTKQNLKLAKLQLEVINKQFINDSLNKIRELIIAQNEYGLVKKQNHESDIVTKQNLFIDNISFLSYETKYQEGFLDSIFGYNPDILYNNISNITSSKFLLLQLLTLYDVKSDSELNNLPILQTLNEAEVYIRQKKINSKFQIFKKYTLLVSIINNTKFPIKLLNTGKTAITIDKLSNDSLFNQNKLIDNNKIIYPNEKSDIHMQIITSLDVILNKEFSIKVSIDYNTIYGKRNKTLKAVFSPEDKSFAIYD